MQSIQYLGEPKADVRCLFNAYGGHWKVIDSYLEIWGVLRRISKKSKRIFCVLTYHSMQDQN